MKMLSRTRPSAPRLVQSADAEPTVWKGWLYVLENTCIQVVLHCSRVNCTSVWADLLPRARLCFCVSWPSLHLLWKVSLVKAQDIFFSPLNPTAISIPASSGPVGMCVLHVSTLSCLLLVLSWAISFIPMISTLYILQINICLSPRILFPIAY